MAKVRSDDPNDHTISYLSYPSCVFFQRVHRPPNFFLKISQNVKYFPIKNVFHLISHWTGLLQFLRNCSQNDQKRESKMTLFILHQYKPYRRKCSFPISFWFTDLSDQMGCNQFYPKQEIMAMGRRVKGRYSYCILLHFAPSLGTICSAKRKTDATNEFSGPKNLECDIHTAFYLIFPSLLPLKLQFSADRKIDATNEFSDPTNLVFDVHTAFYSLFLSLSSLRYINFVFSVKPILKLDSMTSKPLQPVSRFHD